MRYRPPFVCNECSMQSPVLASCPSCAGPMHDRDGNLPPRARRFDERLLPGRGLRGAAVLALTVWIGAALTALFALMARGNRLPPMGLGGPDVWLGALLLLSPLPPLGYALLRRLRSARRERWEASETERLHSHVQQAGERLSIHALPERALVRFVGRVALQEPVAGGLAALHDPDDSRQTGVFLVVDETGAAQLDDDCLELFGVHGEVGRPLEIRDGDSVEVIGRGRWGRGVNGAGASGYRDGAVFVIEGRPDAPVLLRPAALVAH